MRGEGLRALPAERNQTVKELVRMRLQDCAASLGLHSDRDAGITSIETDSRKVGPGCLFIAMKGAKADGHGHIPAAIERGAAAILVEDAAFLQGQESVPHLHCPAIREDLWKLASAFYGNPTRDLTVIGITGTNGKTSTTYYLKGILDAAGIPAGLIGTIQYIVGDHVEKAVNTTPDALELQRLFARMRDAGLQSVVMEVSSHALSLGRVKGVHFDAAVFTNITEDHLDFHGSMENYVDAKLLFLEYLAASCKSVKHVCCNSSIQFGERVHPRIASSGISVRYFGVSSEFEAGQPVPDVAVIDETASLERTSFVLKTSDAGIPVSLEARGFFNVYNSLAAACAALAVGIPLGQIPGGLSRVRIPGRFELVENTRGILVAVDYAHTDDALSNLIRSARRLEPARVITVFGCGGDRDRKKRPLMGHAASSLSDLVIVTSDNPRSEDPDAIIRDIMPGIIDPEKAIIEPDRRRAIFRAVSLARRGDIVLIAGKGHEDYQIFRDRTIHFDDREVAREALS